MLVIFLLACLSIIHHILICFMYTFLCYDGRNLRYIRSIFCRFLLYYKCLLFWILYILSRSSFSFLSFFILLCMSSMSIFICVSTSAHFSLRHSSFACVHYFLYSVLYSVLFVYIVCCLFFYYLEKFSSIIHFLCLVFCFLRDELLIRHVKNSDK